MNILSKLLLITIALLTATWLLSSIYLQFSIEGKIEELTSTFNQYEAIDIRASSLRRGLFNSQIELETEIAHETLRGYRAHMIDRGVPPAWPTIVFSLDIEHGPIFFDGIKPSIRAYKVNGLIDRPDRQKDMIISGVTPIAFNGQFYFNGLFSLDMPSRDASGFHETAAGQTHFDAKGINGSITHDPRSKSAILSFDIEKLSRRHDNFGSVITGLSFSIIQRRFSKNELTYELAINADRLEFDSSTDLTPEIQGGVELIGLVKISDRTIEQASLEYTIRSAVLPNQLDEVHSFTSSVNVQRASENGITYWLPSFEAEFIGTIEQLPLDASINYKLVDDRGRISLAGEFDTTHPFSLDGTALRESSSPPLQFIASADVGELTNIALSNFYSDLLDAAIEAWSGNQWKVSDFSYDFGWHIAKRFSASEIYNELRQGLSFNVFWKIIHEEWDIGGEIFSPVYWDEVLEHGFAYAILLPRRGWRLTVEASESFREADGLDHDSLSIIDDYFIKDDGAYKATVHGTRDHVLINNTERTDEYMEFFAGFLRGAGYEVP